MIVSRYRRRLLVNRFNLAMSMATMTIGMLFLFWILAVLFMNGLEALSPALFTQSTPPPGSAGGLENALYGSLLIVGIATLVATPIGILAGVYLAEYGRTGWFAEATRFVWRSLLTRLAAAQTEVDQVVELGGLVEHRIGAQLATAHAHLGRRVVAQHHHPLARLADAAGLDALLRKHGGSDIPRDWQ